MKWYASNFTIVALHVALAVAGCASTPNHTELDRPGPACPADDEGETCRVERLGDMHVGWLVTGMPFAEAQQRLGPADEVGEPYEEAATGDVVQTHRWRKAGVEIDTARSGASEVVNRVTVEAPFEGKTARGIGIGSAEADVFEVYADVIDTRVTAPGDTLVAGSVYGGIFFRFEGGRVASIFVGAGAE